MIIMSIISKRCTEFVKAICDPELSLTVVVNIYIYPPQQVKGTSQETLTSEEENFVE